MSRTHNKRLKNSTFYQLLSGVAFIDDMKLLSVIASINDKV